MRSYNFLFLLALLHSGCDRVSDKEKVENAQFVSLPAEQTHVNFINKVEDQEMFNILTYRNFYNGGGVALGDINNDGLTDVYLTSNMGTNKLYLNKGNFVFEDISIKAGIEGKRSWSTGVTMADVNADGWLDIYVCNSGDVKGDDKENELFINNHDLTFIEKGEEFNLNNRGLSTQASFFDYDLDGDLDCYILNNSFIAPNKIELFKNVRTEVDELGGDKLYRNDGGIFKDVTVESGIYSSKIGFGLGVSVSDLNNDYLPDIYISNDFWERDYLYINQGNGKFKERLTELLSICSVSSMGADIADINNDGNPEIFTTDMLPADNYRIKAMTIFDNYQLEGIKYRGSYHYQILQNCLHLNNGNLDFQEVSAMSGVSATDWSWGALIFDFQNDGWNDIFVSNGITRDIMYVDFTDFISDKDNIKKIVVEKGRFDWRDFIPYIPSNPQKSFGFVNKQGLNFKDEAEALGLGTPSFSNGAAYGDLDNDGDMDMVVNNVNMTCFVYQNNNEKTTRNNYLKVKFNGNSTNIFGIGATVTLYKGNQKQVLQNFPSRGFQSSVESHVNFGLGSSTAIDSLEVVWPDGKTEKFKNLVPNQVLVLDYKNAKERKQKAVSSTEKQFVNVSAQLKVDKAVHKENLYNDFNQEWLSLRMFSTEGPALITGDVNGDKLEDFVLLGAAGDEDKLFIQSKEGTFSRKLSLALSQDSTFESTCGAFIDLNNDGNQELIIGSGGNEPGRDKKYFSLRTYANDGKGNFKRIEDVLASISGNFSCIVPYDYDADGFTDLFIGSRLVAGSYGLTPKSFLIQNKNGKLSDVASADLASVGLVTDAAWTDYDVDGDKDLMIVGDWMPVTIFLNEKGSLGNKTVIPKSAGWWNRLKASDLDDDGDEDIILGNWGLNSRFRASSSKPLTMYVKDFDNNGKSEFIINWYPPLDTIAYPFATKMEVNQQIPALKKTNLKYEDYGHKTYETLLPEPNRENALSLKTEMLESAILWNDKGTPAIQPLNVETQVTPIFGIVADDFDGDGIMDIWLGGNFFGLKPQVGRHNSSKGIYLKGLGNRKFDYLNPMHSGMLVEGEVRDVKTITVKGSKVYLVARNDASVQAFIRKVK
jgi:hypothetical protein